MSYIAFDRAILSSSRPLLFSNRLHHLPHAILAPPRLAMNAPNPRLQQEERPTRLTGKKDGYTFECWVKVEGEELKIYSEAEMDDSGSEAWIASEEGKVTILLPQLHETILTVVTFYPCCISDSVT